MQSNHQAITNLKVAKVQVRHDQPKAGDTNHQAYGPNVIGVLFLWSLAHLGGLTIWIARKLEEEGDYLTGMTKCIGTEIGPPPRRSRIWMLGLMPSIPVQMSKLLWML